jgi:hypothetical protein
MIRARPLAPLTALAVLLSLAATARAQTAPTARQVIDRYIAAIGGRDAILSQKGRRMWGAFEVAAQGLSGPIEIFAAPNRLLINTEIPGMGSSTSGYDGETAWMMNPAMGPMLLDGMSLQQMRHQADFYSPVDIEKHMTSMEVVGEPDFEGKRCYQVRFKTTWNEEFSEYFDQATGLLVGTIRKQATPMGEIEAVSVSSDYRKLGDLLMAHTVRVKAMGFEQVIRMDSVAVAPLPDSVFALPQAIQALKKK